MRRIAAIALLGFLAGCSAPKDKSARLDVAPDQYPAAFDAARDVLREYGFELDRVDARAGVITSLPKPSAGFATPWDREQSSGRQEWEDLINMQERRVRIVFEPRTGDDMSGPLVAHVQVAIDRVQRPGWRLDSTAIRAGSSTIDPVLEERDMVPTYTVPFSQDVHLAARLIAAIGERAAIHAGR